MLLLAIAAIIDLTVLELPILIRLIDLNASLTPMYVELTVIKVIGSLFLTTLIIIAAYIGTAILRHKRISKRTLYVLIPLLIISLYGAYVAPLAYFSK